MFYLAQVTPKQSQKQMKRVGKSLRTARMFLDGLAVIDLSRAESPLRTVATDVPKPRTGPIHNEMRFPALSKFELARLTAYALTFIASYAYADNTFHPVYEAQGTIHFQMGVQNHKTNLNQQDWEFSIEVDRDSRWKLILETGLKNDQFNDFSSTEIVSFDGSNIYSVIYSDLIDLHNREVSVLRKRDEGVAHPARIAGGPYPLDHGPVVGLLWFAFVGGNILAENGNTKTVPNLLLASARTDPLAWASDIHDLRQLNGRLIKFAEHRLNRKKLTEVSRFCFDLDEPDTNEALEKRELLTKHLLEKGDPITISRYYLDDYSVLDEEVVPLKFRCEIDYPVVFLNTNMYSKFSGVVTKLGRGKSANILPELKGVITAQDRRFRNKLPHGNIWRRDISYQMTRGWITDTNDEVLQSIARTSGIGKRLVSLELAASERRAEGLTWKLVVIIAIVAWPLFILFKMGIKILQQKPNKQK